MSRTPTHAIATDPLREPNRSVQREALPGPARHAAAVALVILAALASAYGLLGRGTTPAGHGSGWNVVNAGFEPDALAPRSQAGRSARLVIDLNSATTAQLELLPGIGPAKAKAIVDDRDANGRFASVDDLDRVPGIGPKTVDRLREHVTAGSPISSPSHNHTDDR